MRIGPWLNDSEFCEVTPFALFSAGPAGAEVCVFVRPDELDPSMVFGCPGGLESSDAAGVDFRGCCGRGDGAVLYSYDFLFVDGSAEVLIRVSGLDAAEPCVSYLLDYKI